jgi:hypothetical protein
MGSVEGVVIALEHTPTAPKLRDPERGLGGSTSIPHHLPRSPVQEFARISGRALIAEGIETELERTTLTELAVRFGQGCLLGAPAPAEAWVHLEIEDPDRYAADPASAAWEGRDPDSGRPARSTRRRPRRGSSITPVEPKARRVDPGAERVGWQRP